MILKKFLIFDCYIYFIDYIYIHLMFDMQKSDKQYPNAYIYIACWENSNKFHTAKL